jgi:mRNA interferase MazF
LKRGDIVLIVLKGELGKPRPGVIVQADEFHDSTTSVLICPMSSAVTEFHRIRPIVEPTASNGLRLRSQIMTDKMNTLGRDRIRQVLGSLDTKTSEKLDRALLLVLGLAR